MDLKGKAKALPETPGVYIMMDSAGNIIYIGKAKSLKNRVSQYFYNLSKHPPKIQRMIEGIRAFDYIHADTELEALLLECRLIKDFKPMYNSQLKNHRKYVYIKIDLESKFPTLEIAAEKEEKSLFFGPYTSSHHVERAINVIKETLKIRQCGSFVKKNSGCLNFQLGFCLAPCMGEITEADYRRLIDEVIDFLKGSKSDLIKKIEYKMLAAAERMEFDKAAKFRDDKVALEHLNHKQKTIQFTSASKLIVAIENIQGAQYKLFIFKGSRVVYKERIDLEQKESSIQSHIVQLVFRYKEELMKNENNGIDKDEIDQAQIVYSYLRNKKQCLYMTVSKSWLVRNQQDKLENGIEKLVKAISDRGVNKQ